MSFKLRQNTLNSIKNLAATHGRGSSPNGKMDLPKMTAGNKPSDKDYEASPGKYPVKQYSVENDAPDEVNTEDGVITPPPIPDENSDGTSASSPEVKKGSYVKKGGKATGNMKDYAIGSQARYDEYEARGWKHDETSKVKEKKDTKKVDVEEVLNSAKNLEKKLGGNPFSDRESFITGGTGEDTEEVKKGKVGLGKKIKEVHTKVKKKRIDNKVTRLEEKVNDGKKVKAGRLAKAQAKQGGATNKEARKAAKDARRKKRKGNK